MSTTISPQMLKALVRPMFVGPFTVVDYSAIESRILAWLAGEEWKLQAFREGRDMYVEIASRMGEYTRQQGKTAELALGFAGGIGALRRMGAKEETDAELEDIRDLWRGLHPRTTFFWRAVDLGFQQGGRAGRIHWQRRGRDMHAVLPSGRALVYRDARVFYDPEEGKTMTYLGPQGQRMFTWHGSLVENVVQATARDILAAALVRMDARGYPIAGHVHDEVILDGLFDVEDIAAQMCELEPWMEGLPLAAEGQQTDRYTK